MGTFATYNIQELRSRFDVALGWATNADERARKALLYCEHACLMSEHAEAQGLLSRHASFSRALAFLQLFKALSLLLGEPGTDRDYQRRFKDLGLPDDFWNVRVRPLYKIRNDQDVAHYSESVPDAGSFAGEFRSAMIVLKEVLTAHFASRTSRIQTSEST